MVSLGQAFEEMLVGVCEEEFDRFSITGESARSLFRALVKAVQLSARSTSKEFATQSSMVLGVEQAWAKRQELMHTRVNTLLTIVATIFLPLTFLAGVYGMNFDDEAGNPAIPLTQLGKGFLGYEVFWMMSVSFMLILFVIFSRMKWFALVGLDGHQKFKLVGAILVITVTFPFLELVLYHTEPGYRD
eukprot:TRINITY_DN5203_c0_g1_i2.p1 TRINITY_DN5203_c0_g1~~TRINITY_DN5203_c0_g1_i2.p1  ORF type:complete len:188 (+),score=24.49 TRINITY_DN5203_c0_g1_i2:170-733(+)